LANGPSLKKTFEDEKTLNFIKSKRKICVNFAPNQEIFFELKPEFMVLMDPMFFTKEIYLNDEKFSKMQEGLKKATWPIKIFMPYVAKYENCIKNTVEENKNLELIYIETKVSKQKNIIKRFKEYEKNITMPKPQNVLIACLYVAINLSIKNIYIFGADHSWHNDIAVREDNVLCFKNVHYYDNEAKMELKPFKKIEIKDDIYTMSEFFSTLSLIYSIYEEIEKYSKYMNVKIYNASNFSFIDAFERVDVGR